ncbi:pre-peptidase C-terminal domain-containing protein [Gloeocapsa sp. PCC 73106]|uniref:pre-peptidase C-terminal domain-containing protein n=1 Tax=Gloeocapsa sp. PCC 73106 TaxID=102232 RepID=UPI0002AC5EA1|nr:pre-peptidase C-terminal domain-containing protein [Gloeocapsa sp. PCC 73106]ELR98770.1 putative pre-peptidase [Gloeocapsa sp. PCC 73106]
MEVITGVAWESTFYEVNVPEGAEALSIDLLFSHSAGDIDLYLYDSQRNLIESSLSTADNESINISTPSPGTYFIQVEPFEVTGNSFELIWEVVGVSGGGGGDDSYELNNSLDQAYDFSNNAGNLLSTIAGAGIAWDNDFYAINVPEGAEELSVEALFNHSAGDIDLSLYDSQGNLVESSVSTENNESINIPSPTAGTYYIDVYPYEVTGNTYDLRWETVGGGSGGGDDGYELNNSLDQAYDFSNSAGNLLSTIAGAGIAWDNDFYAINVPEGAEELSVEALFNHSAGDIDLSLYDSQGNLVESSVSTENNELINIPSPTAGTYYIDVYPYEVTGNTYDLRWETTGSSGGGGDGDSTTYDIDLVFVSEVTESQQRAFNEAAKRWEEAIIGDLPEEFSSRFNQEVDDLVIQVNIAEDDGPGGTLGFAGPRELRDGSLLPYSGEMSFDVADIGVLEQQGQLEDVIVHEMGHVIGIGTVWDTQIEANNTPEAGFIGNQAVNEYQDIFRNTDNFVPVETDGGPGTAFGHWDEELFTRELMSGFLNDGKNPLSRITIGALDDLGYEVNLAAADDYDPFTASIVSLQDVTNYFDAHSNTYVIRGSDRNNDIEGTDASDLIQAGSGRDLLVGLNGDDTLDGGRGRDTLNGGNGDDSLTGGRSRDSFHFEEIEAGTDVITDFRTSDLISVSRSGFGGSLSRGTLDDAAFTSVSSLDDLDDDFTLGFVYSRREGILAYLDQTNDIPLTEIAVLQGEPRLNSDNIRIS